MSESLLDKFPCEHYSINNLVPRGFLYRADFFPIGFTHGSRPGGALPSESFAAARKDTLDKTGAAEQSTVDELAHPTAEDALQTQRRSEQ